MELTTKKLHDNHLKLLKFINPDEIIKKWIETNINEVGYYHTEIDWIFPVINKIESFSNLVHPINFRIDNGIIELVVYNDFQIGNFLFSYKSKYEYDYKSKNKIENIYIGVLKFIDWFNDLDQETKNIFTTDSIKRIAPCNIEFIDDSIKKVKYHLFDNAKSIQELKIKIAEVFHILPNELDIKTRVQGVVKARQLAMVILYNDGYSLNESGIFFGKDHSTVLHAKTTIKNILSTKDALYYKKVISILDYFKIKESFQKNIIDEK